MPLGGASFRSGDYFFAIRSAKNVAGISITVSSAFTRPARCVLISWSVRRRPIMIKLPFWSSKTAGQGPTPQRRSMGVFSVSFIVRFIWLIIEQVDFFIRGEISRRKVASPRPVAKDNLRSADSCAGVSPKSQTLRMCERRSVFAQRATAGQVPSSRCFPSSPPAFRGGFFLSVKSLESQRAG